MNVGFYDFASLHHEQFRKEIIERFTEITEKNAFVEGHYNDLFEKEFAEKQGAKHCLLVANGTDALEISLKAVGVKAGDKVAVAGISFYASAEAVVNIGAIPVFVDVDPHSGLIDPESLKRVIEQHAPKAVMPVHIYGLPCDIEKIESICSPLNIPIIEDAAQAQGGSYLNGKPIGSSQNLVTFSFYPTKNLGAFGDAGAILTQDDHLKSEILSLRNHGRSPEGFRIVGRNSRCDHLQAAVLHLKLKSIDEQNKNRKKAAKLYFEKLKDLPIHLLDEKYLETSSWHLFPIFFNDGIDKEAVKEHLVSKGIGCSTIFYGKAQIDERPLQKYEGEKEYSQKVAKTSFCLPMHAFLTEEHIEHVAQTLKDFLSK